MQLSDLSGGTATMGSKGALSGIKVLDLSRLLPGPYCSMILADHGAEVIPIKLSRTPGSVRTPPDDFGARGREILCELGYTPEEIDAFEAQDII